MTVPSTVERHPIGPESEFPEDEFRVFTINDREIGVIRTDGGFHAVLNRCPHQGAPICSGRLTGTMVASDPGRYEYSAEKKILVCPWHRWEFELATGQSAGGVTRRRLATFDVEVEEGEVFLLMKGVRR